MLAVCTALLTVSLEARSHVAAQTETPPRALAIEPLEVEAGDAGITEEIEAIIIVDVEGRARVETCDATAVLCTALEHVIGTARFEPATRDGAPIAARIRMRFDVDTMSTPPAVGADDADRASTPAAPVAGDEASTASEPAIGFRARAVAAAPAGTRRFTLESLRDVPGAFGDPYRAVEAMPGVVPVASGVPYYFIRGAPPAGTLNVYDGIPLPILFHLGVGPAVVHPRMLGDFRLHAGAAPARYGRMVGGVITADGPRDEGRLVRAGTEIELRALDLNGYVEAPIDGGGELRGAIRWGWPALLADLVYGGSELFFGDYQVRARIPVSPHDHVETVALGSFDRLDLGFSVTEIQFHRAEVRLVRRIAQLELGIALRAAYDHSRIDGTTVSSDPLNPLALEIETGTIGPRVWASWRDSQVRIAGGAELFAGFGKPSARLATLTSLPARPDTIFTTSSTRSTAAAWLELGLHPMRELDIELGGRVDTWITGDVVDGAIDPRARVIWHVVPELDLHVGAGVARQPANFYLPLPGLSDVALQRGLQTAIQGELGGRVTLGSFEGELTAFVHHYDGLLFTDAFVLVDVAEALCARPGGACVPLEADPRTSGISWGGEVFLRIAPDELLSGWVSYTLSWVELEPVHGLPYRPSFDVRHVLSVVAQWRVIEGLTIGARAFVRSGSVRGQFWVSERDRALHRHEQELDPFFRADASIAYAWDAGWARLRLSLEWLNVTIAQEPFGIECPNTGPPASGRCATTMAPPIFAPNIGLRAEL